MNSDSATGETDKIKVKVRYFAHAREYSGILEETLDFPGSISIDEVVSRVIKKYPKISGIENLVFLKNGSPSGRDKMIGDGDVLAVVPPIAGG